MRIANMLLLRDAPYSGHSNLTTRGSLTLQLQLTIGKLLAGEVRALLVCSLEKVQCDIWRLVGKQIVVEEVTKEAVTRTEDCVSQRRCVGTCWRDNPSVCCLPRLVFCLV